LPPQKTRRHYHLKYFLNTVALGSEGTPTFAAVSFAIIRSHLTQSKML
jgi:hypothetical protein